MPPWSAPPALTAVRLVRIGSAVTAPCSTGESEQAHAWRADADDRRGPPMPLPVVNSVANMPARQRCAHVTGAHASHGSVSPSACSVSPIRNSVFSLCAERRHSGSTVRCCGDFACSFSPRYGRLELHPPFSFCWIDSHFSFKWWNKIPTASETTGLHVESSSGKKMHAPLNQSSPMNMRG
jgi:hypothetical protein